MKLIDQRANRLQSFFFLFVKIVVAAGDRCIFYGVNFDCTFDHRSYAHDVGQEQHFVAGLIFTADTRKKLVQIVEHFDHVGVSLILILGAKAAAAHFAVRAEKDRRVKEEWQAWIVTCL